MVFCRQQKEQTLDMVGLFNAKTKNMACDIFRYDFQSCGRTMEQKSKL